MSILTELSKGESRKLEFKQQLPNGNSIAKTIVAFSNGAGGKLAIGVQDNGGVSGISSDDMLELPDKISNIIHDYCYPAIIPEIYSENVNGKLILIIEVFPGNLKPYYLKSEGKNTGVYIRVGATNKLADMEMILELERQKRNLSFDEEILYNLDINKLNFEKLKRDFFKYTNKDLTDEGLVNLKILKEENGATHPTHAAALLTDNNYFEFARIKCARFKGNDISEFIDQKDFNGALYEQIENTINFAKTHLSKRGKITELQRQDEYEVPLVSIREAIANAVVHRDYSISGSDIKFAIFDDRIEITSPGLLPKTLDIENIKSGRSEIRNKVLARFFKEIRFIEEWGTGIRRIITSCIKANLKEPAFIETGMHFKVVIYRNSSGLVADSSGLVADSGGLNEHFNEKLSLNESAIIHYLENNKTITNKEGTEVTKLSPAGVRKLFSALQKKNLITAVGEGRNRYYTLK